MKINQRIIERRKELGLSQNELADRVGLSIHEYSDIEQHADEAETAVSLRNLKKLCGLLSLNFNQIFNLQCAFCEVGTSFDNLYSLLRNELIHKKREEMGLSFDQLGDRLGFYQEAIEKMEQDQDYLEGWSFENIKNLSHELGIPLQVLLGVKCDKCGR